MTTREAAYIYLSIYVHIRISSDHILTIYYNRHYIYGFTDINNDIHFWLFSVKMTNLHIAKNKALPHRDTVTQVIGSVASLCFRNLCSKHMLLDSEGVRNKALNRSVAVKCLQQGAQQPPPASAINMSAQTFMTMCIARVNVTPNKNYSV